MPHIILSNDRQNTFIVYHIPSNIYLLLGRYYILHGNFYNYSHFTTNNDVSFIEIN